LPFANLAFLLLCCFGTFLAERSSSSLRQMCNSAPPSRGFCGLLDVPTSCSSLFGRRHFCYLNYYSFSNLVRNGPGRLVFRSWDLKPLQLPRRAEPRYTNAFMIGSPLSSLDLTFKYRATAQHHTCEFHICIRLCASP